MKPAILYVGDDFTGATDTLATASRAGLRSLLALGVPDAQRLAAIEALGPLDCLGIAGAMRAMSAAEMQAALQPVVDLACRLAPRVLHYKTCSTFDSAPGTGSIGEAVRALRGATGDAPAMVVGGQPNLGRYALFGNLFAAAGQGGEVHRLDRHPTMSRHPVTPMHEADLRRHLAAQDAGPVGLVPWTDHALGEAALRARVQASAAAGDRLLLWDLACESRLPTVGRQLWAAAARQAPAPLLAVGPSSVTQALAAAWPEAQPSAAPVASPVAWPPGEPGPIAPAGGPVLVMAGSLSEVTARQVARSTSFARLTLDANRLARGDAQALEAAAGALAAGLAEGRHMLACTVAPDGARSGLSARALADAGGALLAAVLSRQRPARVGIAGGDTSSHAVQALDAWGLSYRGQVAAGAPLCRLHSRDPGLDGLELMLKGGQMGDDAVFERLIRGTD